MALPISCHNRSSCFVRKILNTLLCAEVELYPGALVLGIDHREGVTSKEMHVTKGLWNSTVGHNDGDLMKRLRKERPEVPVILRAAETGAGIALDGMVEIREAQRIAEEKDRGIVSDEVPVSLFSVELESSAANIALGICCPALPRDG